LSLRITIATARRALAQLRRDPRTIALILVVPPALLTLLRYVFDSNPAAFQRVAVPLVGLFPLIVMFLVTSIAMLRERTGGTLERLMSMPLAKLDLLAGYGLAFASVAAAQACITSVVAFRLLHVETAGSPALVVTLAVCNALLGVALGLFLSAFATSEFQAVQFMPAVLLPQIILSGLFVPRAELPRALRIVSALLPVSYAYDGLARVAAGLVDARLWADCLLVLASVVLALTLGATTLRRRTP
jgi:ABC-2 type transport system permease protein